MSARDVIDLTLMGRGYDRTEGTSDAILSALHAAGYAVAPREATVLMVAAAIKRPADDDDGNMLFYGGIYSAMLAAAEASQ